MQELRTAFAGDRDVSVWALQFLLEQQVRPLALMVSDPHRASHAQDLMTLCSYLSEEHILIGKQFRTPDSLHMLRDLDIDYLICVHFPYLVPPEMLAIPNVGVLNLHPAYLPYNRGWHTPSWALLEGTPIGATLHFMDSGVDTGDIIHQKELIPLPDDTAQTLYQRLKLLEFEVFREAWPQISAAEYKRLPQKVADGTTHKRSDLFEERIQKLDLNAMNSVGEVLLRLRALTTNNLQEAAYYEVQDARYRVQVIITREEKG
jgi:methionyl-tRNA formyltransferase